MEIDQATSHEYCTIRVDKPASQIATAEVSLYARMCMRRSVQSDVARISAWHGLSRARIGRNPLGDGVTMCIFLPGFSTDLRKDSQSLARLVPDWKHATKPWITYHLCLRKEQMVLAFHQCKKLCLNPHAKSAAGNFVAVLSA